MSSCCAMKAAEAPQKKGFFAKICDVVKPYKPLVVMVLVVLVTSAVVSVAKNEPWMPLFMGLFLMVFSMLKLFDVKGFATSFAMYDVVAARSKAYALAYPFVEFALALAYLSFSSLALVNIVTAVVMAVGLVGIIKAKFKKMDVKCACMGSFIDVPVGYVTIIENTTMLLMALLMIAH